MQILEIMVFEDKEGLFSELSQFLPLVKIEQAHLPTFRLEIEQNLILLIYQVGGNHTLSLPYLKNVFPHLSRLLWLTDQQNFLDLKLPEEFQSLFDEYDPYIPSTIILAGDGQETNQLKESGIGSGYYLGPNSRLFFWNRSLPADRKRIWQMMWEE
jgi:hypothetical protein